MATVIIDEFYDVTTSPPERIRSDEPKEVHRTPRRWKATGQIHRRDNHDPVGDPITETRSSREEEPKDAVHWAKD